MKRIKQLALFIAILQTSRYQTAMECPKLKLLNKITVDGKIGKIRLCKLSDTTLEALGGKSCTGSYCNEILMMSIQYPLTDCKSRFPSSDETKLKLYNIKTKKKLLEIDSNILGRQTNRFNYLKPKIVEKENHPFIHFHLKNQILQYDPILAKSKLLDNPDQKEPNHYKLCLSSWKYIPVGKIYHHDYTAFINEKRNLQINHTNQETVIIELPEHGIENLVFASPKKDSPYILVHRGIPQSFRSENYFNKYDAIVNKTILYNIYTGEPHVQFTNIPHINRKYLKSAIFGKHDDFLILAFEKEVFIYDLIKCKIKATYNFAKKESYITRTILTKDENQILVATHGNIDDNNLYTLANPLASKDRNEIEKIEYLRKKKDVWLSEQEREKLFVVNIGGIKIPIEKCWFM